MDKTAGVSTCAKCESDSCVPCQRPDHLRESYVEYKSRIRDRVDEEEDKSPDTIKKTTKAYPKYGMRVQKDGGCDHMSCEYTEIRMTHEWNSRKAISCLESDIFRKAFTGKFKVDSRHPFDFAS